jgi:hypothetical protein
MGPPSYMRSVVDRNVVIRRISVPTRRKHENIINTPKENRYGVVNWVHLALYGKSWGRKGLSTGSVNVTCSKESE